MSAAGKVGMSVTSILTALFVFSAAIACAQDSTSTTYGETRVWMRFLGLNSNNHDALAALFRTGDDRIKDLIEGLKDKDKNVRLGAQRAIRYLGNPTGVQALAEEWKKGPPRVFTGPVPQPVSELDFEISKGIQNGFHGGSFEFAFLLDGSPRAEKQLQDRGGGPSLPNQGWLVESKSEEFETYDKWLAGLILNNALWASQDKEEVGVRLLAYTGKKDKVLAVVTVGEIFTTGFHVVLERRKSEGWNSEWRYFSISMAWVH